VLNIIPTEHSVPSARTHRTAHISPRFEVMLAVWAITVLLIAIANFDAKSPFLGAFDVSVAPF
jgi:hypothetical protein